MSSKRNLEKILSVSDDELFLQLIWSLNAIQTNRASKARRNLNFPSAAATTDPLSTHAIRIWELETLANLALTIKKDKKRIRRGISFNHQEFESAATVVNILRSIESREFLEYQDNIHILKEMHRILQRQLQWQRGFTNTQELYRSAFIYGQEECAEFFNQAYGISIQDFTFIGYAMFCCLRGQSSAPFFLPKGFGISPEVYRQAMMRLSKPIEEARKEAQVELNFAKEKLGSVPIAFRPSFFRRFPIITFGNWKPICRSPLPDLIIYRITSGLYYDTTQGGSKLINLAADRFEEYSLKITRTLLSKFDVSPSKKYAYKKNIVETPDIIVKTNDKLEFIIECKSAKLSYAAQFSSNPLEDAAQQYEQLAKGIQQIWRFSSHLRCGYIKDIAFDELIYGMVLTNDNWIEVSGDIRDDVFELANSIASEDEILEKNRCGIVFCHIREYEQFLMSYNEQEVRSIISTYIEKSYPGWALTKAAEDAGFSPSKVKSYPFDVNDVLPWWNQLDELKG